MVLSLPEATRVDFDLLTEALKKRFTGSGRSLADVQNLLVRRMLPDETVHSFASDIRKLCRRLGKSKEDTVERFIHGLREDLLMYVLERSPVDFDQAVDLATTAEQLRRYQVTRAAALNSLSAPSTYPNFPPSGPVAHHPTYPSPQTPTPHITPTAHTLPPTADTHASQIQDAVSAVVTALRETVIDIRKEIPHNSHPPRAYRSSRQNYSRDDRSDIICFYCGRSGHAQRNCPTRQAEIPRTPTCQYCFYRGHTIDECRKRAGDMRSVSRDGGRRPNPSNDRRQYSRDSSNHASSRARRDYSPPRDQRRSYAPTPRDSPPDYSNPPRDHRSSSPHMSRREPLRGTGAPPPERDGYYADHRGHDPPSGPSMMARRGDHTERRVSFSDPSN